jgi:hypothetical protein
MNWMTGNCQMADHSYHMNPEEIEKIVTRLAGSSTKRYWVVTKVYSDWHKSVPCASYAKIALVYLLLLTERNVCRMTEAITNNKPT